MNATRLLVRCYRRAPPPVALGTGEGVGSRTCVSNVVGLGSRMDDGVRFLLGGYCFTR